MTPLQLSEKCYYRTKLPAALHPCLHSCTLYFWSNKKHNTTKRNIFFFPRSGQVKGGMCSCAASDAPTLLLTLRKRLSVNQIGAASQTRPGVRCYRASSRQCYIVRYTQRIHLKEAEDFNEGTAKVRRSSPRTSPFVEKQQRGVFLSARLRRASSCDSAPRLWRGEKFPITVFCPQRGLNRNRASALKSQITNLDFARGGGFTHLCPSTVIPNI